MQVLQRGKSCSNKPYCAVTFRKLKEPCNRLGRGGIFAL